MKTKDLTLNALFIAITLVLALVPGLGMINIGFVSITIMHIPVIVAGVVLGYRSALINALAFGLAALFIAATRPTGLFDPLFINPLVSVLPRLIFGLAVVAIYNVMKKVTKNYAIRVAITAALSTFVHTIVVLVAMYIAATGSGDPAILANLPGSVLVLITGVLASNGVAEIIASVVIATPVATALSKLHRG